MIEQENLYFDADNIGFYDVEFNNKYWLIFISLWCYDDEYGDTMSP